MKHFFLLVCACLHVAAGLYAQSVGINTDGSAADPSAALDIKSNNKGILVPRMTTAQRNAIVSPATGLLVFQTDATRGFCYYDGDAWLNLTSGNVIDSLGHSVSYGFVTTFAGVGGYGLGVDSAGYVYLIADRIIHKITPNGTVGFLAGNNVQGSTDGTGPLASFYGPYGIALDATANVYVSEELISSVIRKITPASEVTTFAGLSGLTGDVDGTGAAASFLDPRGLATDAAGNIYVADYGNDLIRKITPAAVVTTIAGNGSPGAVDGAGVAASFSGPSGIAVDATGNLYVADEKNHKIRKITPAGVVTSFAGSGSPGAADGTGAAASFNSPTALAIDAFGNLYVADRNNHKIRKVIPLANGTGAVYTIAGNGLQGNANGPGQAATFHLPHAIAVDASGNLYVTENGVSIRKIIFN